MLKSIIDPKKFAILEIGYVADGGHDKLLLHCTNG